MADDKTPDKLFGALMQVTNAAGKQHFNSEYEESRVQIIPDKNISLGMFKPHPLLPGAFKAHPTTIRAMRKDIFVAGNEMFEDLEDSHCCEGCGKEIDLQFWVFCPFCETIPRV